MINKESECHDLATFLCLNKEGEDLVEKLRAKHKEGDPTDIAAELFRVWLRGPATAKSSRWRVKKLARVFSDDMNREGLVKKLIDEIEVCRGLPDLSFFF